MENVKASVPGTHAGPGGRHREHDPADGDGPAHGADQADHVRRRAAAQADRGHVAAVRRQRLDADHHDRPVRVLRLPERHLVHFDVRHRPVDRGGVGPGLDLLDPPVVAALLPDLRPGLRLDAHGRLRRLHAGLHGRHRLRRRRRLRHRLRLHALDRHRSGTGRPSPTATASTSPTRPGPAGPSPSASAAASRWAPRCAATAGATAAGAGARPAAAGTATTAPRPGATAAARSGDRATRAGPRATSTASGARRAP